MSAEGKPGGAAKPRGAERPDGAGKPDGVGESQALREAAEGPTEEALERALGPSYAAYRAFLARLEGLGIAPEWRYYADGKAWLCKASRKSKTVLWISAWEGLFKATFYFTESSGAGIESLPIGEAVKESYLAGKPIGRLKPLTLEIRDGNQVDDAVELAAYKTARLTAGRGRG